MTPLFDQIAWWVGAVSIALAAAVGVGAIIAGMALVAAELAAWGARRMYIVVRNFRDVYAWVQNGRPEWKQWDDSVWRMTPHDRAPTGDPEDRPAG